MTPKPYVGITGLATSEDIAGVLNEFVYAGYSMRSGHMPLLGFLVSYKTLNGIPTANRRYPMLKDLPRIMRLSNAFNMIHYNSREMPDLAKQVEKVFDYIPGLCDALQLNIAWPWSYQVNKIRERFPEMKIVFQASSGAMRDRTPKAIAEGIRLYGDSINYVLIDPSGGQGKPFDIKKSLAVYSEIRSRVPYLKVGFAGGFTGENVAERLEALIGDTRYLDFCIDAEGGLRDKITGVYGDDLLNLEKVRGYLQAASSVLK